MPILRRNKKDYNFTQVDNQIPEDKNLSWKAKGILIYLLSRPDDWEFNKKDITKRATDGGHSTNSGIEELKENGYLEIKKIKDEKGRFDGWEWIVTEEVARNPENPKFGKSEVRKTTPYTNTKKTNTNNNKKNIKKRIINYFFKKKGYNEMTEKEIKMVSKRYNKTAKNLSKIAGFKKIKEAIDIVAEWAESRDLEWTLQTVEKKWGEIDTMKPKKEKKKPYFRGQAMTKRNGQWFVMPKDGGQWLEFAGSEKDIEWK